MLEWRRDFDLVHTTAGDSHYVPSGWYSVSGTALYSPVCIGSTASLIDVQGEIKFTNPMKSYEHRCEYCNRKVIDEKQETCNGCGAPV